MRAMPRFEAFAVVDSNIFESATFIDTPSLRSLWCTATPELMTLDLTDSGLESIEQLDTTLGGKQRGEILRLPTGIDVGLPEAESETGSAVR